MHVPLQRVVRNAVASLLLAISLALLAKSLLLVLILARPLPFWDQWEFVKSIPNIDAGHFTWHDLFAQHNEHRIATARLFFLLDLFFFDGSGYLSIVALCGCLVIIAWIMARQVGSSPRNNVAAFICFAAFLFSPCQWENLASGFQIPFPLVNLLVIGSSALLVKAIDTQQRRQRIILVATASAIDFLGVFSLASGVLSFVPALWICVVLRSRSRLLYLYIIAHIFYCVVFFTNYHRTGGIATIYDPLTLGAYTVLYLGACLRGHDMAPVVLGVVDLILFAFALMMTLRRAMIGKIVSDRPQVFAIAVALFIVSGAVLTASGRASLGLETATSSRYSLQSILFQIAMGLYYCRLAALPAPGFAMRARMPALAFVGLVSVSLASHLAPSTLKEWRDRASVLDTVGFGVVNGVVSDDLLALVYPVPNLIRSPMQFLADHKLGPFSPRFGQVFRPPLNAIAGLALDRTPGCTAQFGAVRTGPHWFKLEGWIYDATRPASGGWVVVLDDTDQDRLVGYGRQAIDRPDVDEATGVKLGRSGFLVGLNGPELTVDHDRTFTALLIPAEASRPTCRADLTVQAQD